MVHLAFQVPAGLISAHKANIEGLDGIIEVIHADQADYQITRHPCWAVCGVYAKDHSAALAWGCTSFWEQRCDSELTTYFYWPGLPTKLRTPTLHKTQDALDSELPEETNCLPDICFNIRSCSYTSPSMMHAFTASVSVRPRLAFHCIQPATDLSQAPGFVHPMGGQDSKSWANVHVYDGQYYTHRYYGYVWCMKIPSCRTRLNSLRHSISRCKTVFLLTSIFPLPQTCPYTDLIQFISGFCKISTSLSANTMNKAEYIRGWVTSNESGNLRCPN